MSRSSIAGRLPSFSLPMQPLAYSRSTLLCVSLSLLDAGTAAFAVMPRHQCSLRTHDKQLNGARLFHIPLSRRINNSRYRARALQPLVASA